jgi:ATP-dependent Zn protease
MTTNIDTITTNILNMIVFDKLKMGNPIIDMILTSICLSLVTYFIKHFNKYYCICKTNIYNIKDIFKNKNVVIYQGHVSVSKNIYDGSVLRSSSFTDSFKALWSHIITNISNNTTINTITEYTIEYNSYLSRFGSSCFIVSQKEKFLLCNDLELYAQVVINNSSVPDDINNKPATNIDTITITIFSYKSNINVIKSFVDNITDNYLSFVEESRNNKLFIYTLINNVYKNYSYELWDEIHFVSTRNFKNMFFENKDNFMNKLDFFLHNKQWYYDKGIPYTLGIGAYGPPGTGKTSLIKAIANYTNRNIISISLKLVKTKTQLNNIFFEYYYNKNNKKEIGFDKKIIVFEDIDCIGDIVLDRNKEITTQVIDTKKNDLKELLAEEQQITLDDILNLWDGIRETSGRIMIITSNYYNKLDKALIRPGRIDITLELSYISHKVIQDMYTHFFNEEMDYNVLKNINEYFYTPAEITNIYLNSNNDKNIFIKNILQNKHL